MKKLLTILILIFCISTVFSQDEKIDISVSSQIKKLTKTISEGTYIISIVDIDNELEYHVTVISEDIEFDELETSEGFGVLSVSNRKTIGTFTIGKQQQLSISIDVLKKVTDTVTKISKTTKIDNYTYSYKTNNRGKWQTTFGFNFIYKTKQNTYYSKADGSSYIISEAANRDKFDFHPTVMFTWHSNKYLDEKKENWKIGISGGIGYDFDKSLSVFLGPSFIYNQNITLTFGGAFHKQKRLTSNYSEGDIINENLTFDQLHTDYIRINPFVSISFRLDKDPFKKD